MSIKFTPVVLFVVLSLRSTWAAAQAASAAAPKTIAAAVQTPPPLDIFAAIAAIAAALALACAALPDFRHRTRVEVHARKVVKKDNIIPLIAANVQVCGVDSWSTLFRLGALRGWKDAKPPGVMQDKTFIEKNDIDHNFTSRIDYRIYQCIFNSNIDKILSVILGSASATVIWFGAVEHTRFPDLNAGGVARAVFLSEVVYFYVVLAVAFLPLMYFAKYIWPHDGAVHGEDHVADEHQKSKFTIGKLLHIGLVLGFFYLLSDTSNGWIISTTLLRILGPMSIHTSIDWIERIVWASVCFPVFLISLGSYVSQAMCFEAERCVTSIKEAFGQAPITASVR